jgi:hypothetical protein
MKNDQKSLPLNKRLAVVQKVFQEIRQGIPLTEADDLMLTHQLLLTSAFSETHTFLFSDNNAPDDIQVKKQILEEFYVTAKDKSVNTIFPIYNDVKMTLGLILSNKMFNDELRKRAYFMNQNLENHRPQISPKLKRNMAYLITGLE